MSKHGHPFIRAQAAVLRQRLDEPRRHVQVVAGPRQVGKSTMVKQVTGSLPYPVRYASADDPHSLGPSWIVQQWDAARVEAESHPDGSVLVIDEIQKIPQWSESVKRLWDEDSRARRPLRVVVLGSAPLLIQSGLTESLAGRFEVIRLPHWSFTEMREAFGWSLDQFIFHGGYPGAAALVHDDARWMSYVRESLIEPSIFKDVLMLTRVERPALLSRLFGLACHSSGQVLSYTKMLGQLQDAGNTTTLAHYLDLLSAAGLVRGLQKFAGNQVRVRGSIPKLQVLNTALMSAMTGLTPGEARHDPEHWGHLVESAVGAHLANAAACGVCELYYWREGDDEVDFVVKLGRRVTAIEVKSGGARPTLRSHAGTALFTKRHRVHRQLLVGGDGIAVEEFLSQPVERWVG